MRDLFLEIIEDIELYNNNRFLIPLFLVALVVLWITEKEKSIKNVLVYLSTALIAIFICPLFAFIGTKFDGEIYYRVWWTIPMGVIICYTFIKIMFRMDVMWKRCIVFLIAIIIIVVNGKLVYTNSYRFDLENKYCVPQPTVDVANYVTFEYDKPVIIGSLELMMYIRQYNSNIQVPFSRFYFGDLGVDNKTLYDALNASEYDTAVISLEAKKYTALYVVLNASIPQIGNMEDYGFEYLDFVSGYYIYRYEQLYQDYKDYGAIK